jgi:hypothetical protein
MNTKMDFTLSDLLERFCHAFSVENNGTISLKKEYESSMWVRITMGTAQSGWVHGDFPSKEKTRFRTTMKVHPEAPGKIVIQSEMGQLFAISVQDMFRYFPDIRFDPLFLGDTKPDESTETKKHA